MRPPYLRRLNNRRRANVALALFMSLVYAVLAVSFARFIIWLSEHYPWL